MAGELSKKIGEDGEKLARQFLRAIKWNIVAENENIPSLKPEEFKKATSQSPRKTHGIDFVVAYDCPLDPSTRRNILISMKNSEKEVTNNQSSLVNNDLKELDQTIQSYQCSVLVQWKSYVVL